jgi:hypothetical protein
MQKPRGAVDDGVVLGPEGDDDEGMRKVRTT